MTGTPLVVMLDIDGTLCEIVERPGDAVVSESARDSLRTLIARSGEALRVAFITGRAVADAQRMLDLDGVAIYGNHGMERLLPFGDSRAHVASGRAAPELRDFVGVLADVVSDFPGVSIEDKHFSLTLHFRGIDMARLPEFNARVAQLVEGRALRLSPGKWVLNVLPEEGLTKGDAVLEIIQDVIGDSMSGSVLFVGDDITDEDAFRELRPMPNAVTVRVGSVDVASAAKLSLDNPHAVHELLALLAESRA